ncbi:FxLYD domain-containing protein [Streptomyces sp. NPDC004609]|uniref:FxLYD domain-containing protein n=1 Tax=Streptomyces sp. NPDC004609 TaxID=3364704 RepID=UPI00367CF876
MPVILAVVGVFVVLIIAVAITQNDGGGSPDGKSSTQSSGKVADAPVQQDTKGADRPKDLKPEDDVKITSCEVDSALSWPSAKLTITNQSSDTSNYLVSVEFVDAQGVRIGEGFAATNNLAPDRSAKEVAQGTAEAKGKITCKVTKVTRYAS